MYQVHRIYGYTNFTAMVVEGIDLHVEDILVSLVLSIINPFVTRPGDLRNLVRPFRYEARRSPGLIS